MLGHCSYGMRTVVKVIFFTCMSFGVCDWVRGESKTMNQQSTESGKTEIATLGGGCYWCLEAAFRQFDGVVNVTSGFMGGHLANPSYRQICEGDTGHAEVVQVTYDPNKVSYEALLKWFWQLHDPTTLNRQGYDEGTQYRSVIFYHSEDQKTKAQESMRLAASDFKNPMVTELSAASVFYPAQEDHQNYYFTNKSKNPYCRAVIEPKLKKLKLKY